MIHLFWAELKQTGPPRRLLECGARVHAGQEPPELPPDVVRVGTDCEPGEGVDLVADLHDLSRVPEGHFDAVLCDWVLEHVRRPWVVARQLARVTRRGGVLYCRTHQTFPHHPYPEDYYRYSAEALVEVFSAESGWESLGYGHLHPCKVVPLDNEFSAGRDWNFAAQAWLVSWCLVRRREG